jgi:hypothetical protein
MKERMGSRWPCNDPMDDDSLDAEAIGAAELEDATAVMSAAPSWRWWSWEPEAEPEPETAEPQALQDEKPVDGDDIVPFLSLSRLVGRSREGRTVAPELQGSHVEALTGL